MDNNRLFIFDTTLRDGEQVPGCQLNTVEKIQVAKQLELLRHLATHTHTLTAGNDNKISFHK
jgi:hypothetical protein